MNGENPVIAVRVGCDAAICPQCGHRNSNKPQRRSIISVTTSLAGVLFGKRYAKWVEALCKKK